jgi:MerR family transcriptional regulator, thiopeptide resistance regulator
MVHYTIIKLARLANISVRTLHYYDKISLLKPEYRSSNGYRQYGEDEAVRLQQIMFFRELDFSLEEIKKIMSRPDFNVIEALQSHRTLLTKRAERLNELLGTVDKTINKLKGETEMSIKEYYRGFSDEQIEKYREEVRQRWGEDTLMASEARVMKMSKEKFAALQAEGSAIFKAISDNMEKGYNSAEVQEQVEKWRQWLENFHHYSDEALLGLGQTYSQHPDFVKFFQIFHKDLPGFLTLAIEYYCKNNKYTTENRTK